MVSSVSWRRDEQKGCLALARCTHARRGKLDECAQADFILYVQSKFSFTKMTTQNIREQQLRFNEYLTTYVHMYVLQVH